MDSSDGASGGERRRSTASRRSLSVSPMSTESSSEESYEFADLTVADGFRPIDTTSQHQPPPQSLLAPPSTSQSRSQSPSPSHASASSSRPQEEAQTSISTPPTASLAPSSNPAPIRSRPSSISKSHRPHESLSLRNDGSDTVNAPRPQLPTLSTGVPLLRNETDSERTGSSHPFASYGSRTVSDTTSSIGGHVTEGEYNGPRGPTHPYALYPQNTVPIDDGNGEPIPVGFNSLGGSYQRQIGPDGEDSGDMIGPLGHMEELPPYTRYPEGAIVRNPSAEAAEAGPSGTNRSPSAHSPTASTNHAIPPQSERESPINAPASAHVPSSAGGIGIATRNPEYSSTDENLSVGRTARSAETSDSSRTDFSTITRDFAEKLPGGKWRRRAKKKLLGVIPYWAICLLVVGLVIVGVVMGTVLGILLQDDNKKKPDGDESGSTFGYRPTADVDYFETLPAGLAPLAVGLFDLPALTYRAAPKSCINDTTQGQAWNCDMPLRYYSVEIGIIPNVSEVKNYNIQLEAINGSKSAFVWGTQPPNIDDPVPLRLVNDTFDISRGPAWWIEITYDKVVWVSEQEFGQNNNRVKRQDWEYDDSARDAFDPTRLMSSNPGPMNGEKAWICTWPNVTMEIFIYPNQNSSSPPWSSKATTTVSSATASATPEASKPPYDPTPAYPQVVKFLERRLFFDNDETAAVCKQVKIVNDGHDTEDVIDENGDVVEVVVTERQSSYEEMLEQQERSRHPDDDDSEDRRRWATEQVLRRETLELTDCGCLWFSQ